MVFADSCLVAIRFAAVAIAHDEAIVAKPEQVRRKSPDPNGFRDGPGLASIGGSTLQGFALVGLVVISTLREDGSVRTLDGMEFVIALYDRIPLAGRDPGKPAPGLAVILGDGRADRFVLSPESFAELV